jgi:peroxiredoxin Q/BCP
MAINVGEFVDDFELLDQTGTPRRLSTMLADGPMVLFFYPAAMTGGCTREGCHFRDLAAEFEAAGAQRVGISRDSVGKQRQFAEINVFDFPLLSDPDGAVAAAMGVKRKLPLGALSTRRMTFVIDTDRRVLDIVHNESDMDKHADRALEVIRERSARR